MSNDLGDQENIDALRSLNLPEESIQKLLRMNSKDFRKLVRKASPTPVTGKSEPTTIFQRAKKTIYTVAYTTTCTTCKSVNKFTEDVPKKEYLSHHSSYRNGKINIKVSMCDGCKSYLKTLSKDELMKLVLRTRPEVQGIPHSEVDKSDQLELEALFTARKEYPVVLMQDHIRWSFHKFIVMNNPKLIMHN